MRHVSGPDPADPARSGREDVAAGVRHRRGRAKGEIGRFAFAGEDVAADIRSKYGEGGRLVDLYAGNTGPVVHKWHHYIPIYERYFGAWLGRRPRFLEIGVSKGGSLQLWRSYFGPEAVIFGIDIDPRCRAFDGAAGQVRVGSQDDAGFLAGVVEEMGGVDLVLDDGSHEMAHVRASLAALFPRLPVGGTYMIEDLHTAYWTRYGGGPDAPGNFFNHVRTLIDGMHAWYVNDLAAVPDAMAGLGGIHVHDSIVVLEKAAVRPPVHSKVGGRHARA